MWEEEPKKQVNLWAWRHAGKSEDTQPRARCINSRTHVGAVDQLCWRKDCCRTMCPIYEMLLRVYVHFLRTTILTTAYEWNKKNCEKNVFIFVLMVYFDFYNRKWYARYFKLLVKICTINVASHLVPQNMQCVSKNTRSTQRAGNREITTIENFIEKHFESYFCEGYFCTAAPATTAAF